MNSITFTFGDVTKKKIVTPNDFISHMVEHLAWRLGLSIDLNWEDENWLGLGKVLGGKIAACPKLQETSAALGMIDDGSAEVAIDTTKSASLRIGSSETFDQDWFLDARCEQIENGQSLMEMLEGLSQGLDAEILVTIGSVEDQHHAWEGLYRAVGIALNRIYTPREDVEKARRELAADASVGQKNVSEGEISILERSLNTATVRRGTAESGVTVTVDFTGKTPNKWTISVADSIHCETENLSELFIPMCEAAGFTADVNFTATVLSSSHVVLEDTGMVMGRALLEIMKLRMEKYGINGAGSNVASIEDLERNKTNVAISVEGRKVWRIVPFDGNIRGLKERFLIGQNVLGGLRSEDLDDFIDGFTGGMSASVMVHLKDYSDPDTTWQKVFQGLGKALNETFDVNPYRKGVPPGVKATLS